MEMKISHNKETVAQDVQINLDDVRKNYRSRLLEIRGAAAELRSNPKIAQAAAEAGKGKATLCGVLRVDVSKKEGCVLDQATFQDDSQGEICKSMREDASSIDMGIFDTPVVAAMLSVFGPNSTAPAEPLGSSGAHRIVATQINVSSIDIPDAITEEESEVSRQKGKKRKRENDTGVAKSVESEVCEARRVDLARLKGALTAQVAAENQKQGKGAPKRAVYSKQSKQTTIQAVEEE